MKILILCTGNSCRSQMAEGFLKSFDNSLQVFSAGTNPAQKVNPCTIRVMSELGIDLTGNHPKNADEFTSMEFDYVSWTLDALRVKLEQSTLDTPYYFSTPARHQIVVDYLELMDEILSRESQVNVIYANPEIKDPTAASSDQRIALEHLYAIQRKLAPLAEAVLQEQISTTLASLGLTTGGQPIPPVLFHITHLPYDLVISPRNKIQQDATISLVPDLSVTQQTRLETSVDSGMNVSSLVVPVGGIGSYPTMVMRTTDLHWLSDTIAHEWTHNWLSLRPLGMNYETTPELRTMNETTASMHVSFSVGGFTHVTGANE